MLNPRATEPNASECHVSVDAASTADPAKLHQRESGAAQTFYFESTSINFPPSFPAQKDSPPVYNDDVGIFHLPPECNLTNTSS